jgi:hypothetical protein
VRGLTDDAEKVVRIPYQAVLLWRFGRLLHVLPEGALARLDSRGVCRVVRDGAGDPLRPVAEVVDAALGTAQAGQVLDLSRGETRVALQPHGDLRTVTVRELDDFG